MEIIRLDSIVTAFVRPAEGVNAGLIHTPQGMIMVDTTSSPAEVKGLLESVGASPREVRAVINTHFHSDHTWGNQVFSCPIVAHRLCLERMQQALYNEWSAEELQAYISQLEKSDPMKAEAVRKVVQDLCITLPAKTFDEGLADQLGGLSYEIIHLGGHTPDTCVVWLPEHRILFASDLVFQGRYPYIFDADIPAWTVQLGRLLEFNAMSIIPGHGVLCGEPEISTLRDYLQVTWERTAEHIRLGHSADETAADPNYPRFPGEKYERLHQANIRYMYEKQAALRQ